MFLNLLNEKEKRGFLTLAKELMKADGIITDSESQVLSVYVNEMQIPLAASEENNQIEEVIADIASSSTVEIKRIVYLELMALALCDANYAKEEKLLLDHIAEKFNLSEDFKQSSVSLSDRYINSYISLVHLIQEGD